MPQLFVSALVVALFSLVIYLVASFTAMSFDPRDWGSLLRFLAAGAGATVLIRALLTDAE